MPFSVRCSGALDEVDIETLRPRRLRPDAVACPRRARHRVGASPALTLLNLLANRSAIARRSEVLAPV